MVLRRSRAGHVNTERHLVHVALIGRGALARPGHRVTLAVLGRSDLACGLGCLIGHLILTGCRLERNREAIDAWRFFVRDGQRYRGRIVVNGDAGRQVPRLGGRRIRLSRRAFAVDLSGYGVLVAVHHDGCARGGRARSWGGGWLTTLAGTGRQTGRQHDHAEPRGSENSVATDRIGHITSLARTSRGL